jgi:hypothetical protein
LGLFQKYTYSNGFFVGISNFVSIPSESLHFARYQQKLLWGCELRHSLLLLYCHLVPILISLWRKASTCVRVSCIAFDLSLVRIEIWPARLAARHWILLYSSRKVLHINTNPKFCFYTVASSDITACIQS